MKLKFKVYSADKGKRLLAFLRDHFPKAPSVKALKRSIEDKKCKINGRVETFSTHILKEGDLIEFEWKQLTLYPIHPLVLWEDSDLIAYNKPPMLVCEDKNFSGKLIHRLDKETSGVLLVGKNSKILDLMIEQFKKREIQKTYLAIVDGLVQLEKKTILTKLSPSHHYQGQTVYRSSPQGKEAVTQWELLARREKASLLKCLPITGRTHQLRVHLKESGHPILGDYQYSKRFQCLIDPNRHLLHAYQISFRHPFTEQLIEVIAPIPLDFLDALDQLKMLQAVSIFSQDLYKKNL